MLGEMFSTQSPFSGEQDEIMDAVLRLVWKISERVFLTAFEARTHRPIDISWQEFDSFSIEVETLMRLLRIHRDVNATRQNSFLLDNWPCENIVYTCYLFNTLRCRINGLMHSFMVPVVLVLAVSNLAVRVADIFSEHPKLTARGQQKTQMVQVISAQLANFQSEQTVLDAIRAYISVPGHRFTYDALRSYFCNALNE